MRVQLPDGWGRRKIPETAAQGEGRSRMDLFRNNKGTSMVEFAIIAPLFLILLFGIMEFGLLLYYKAMITNGSREGARTGIVFRATATGTYNPVTTGEITSAVNGYFGSTPPAGLSVSVPDGICTGTGFPLKVLVTYSYTFLVIDKLIPSLSGGPPMSAQSIMRCE
jgi:TadE-like protein